MPAHQPGGAEAAGQGEFPYSAIHPPLPCLDSCFALTWILFDFCRDDKKSFRTRSRSGSREFGRKRGRREASRLHLLLIWVEFSLEVDKLKKIFSLGAFQVSHEQQEKA